MLVSLAARNAGAEHLVVLMQDWVFLELPGLRTTSLGFDLTRGLASLAWLPRGVRVLRKLMATLSPDVVHGWIYYGSLLTLALSCDSVPIVWGIHNTPLPGWTVKPKLRLTDRLLAWRSRDVPARIVYCA